MQTLLIIALIVGLVIRWLLIRARFEELENRLATLERWGGLQPAEGFSPTEPSPQPEPPEPVIAIEPPPTPSLTERLRDRIPTEEWESLLGGSILNKIGALVLVIGIALFLAYSFGYMTPAGRASVAAVTSASILIAGLCLGRRAQYSIFARGLIGAGWAALYATAYAIYALPAARIIHSPIAGSCVLLAVAAGMIGHSLRYRTQTVTAIAYFAAFAALAATPSTPFAVVSLIPLALSLLCLAALRNWHAMAIFGAIATWATCISRGASDAPLASTQALFLTYWILFEAFDLLTINKRVGIQIVAPINALAFLTLSYAAWNHHQPDDLWVASACAAALYLASAICRAIATRLRTASYEGQIVLAAVLAGLSIAAHVPGLWTSVWLAVEAEILYLAGVRLNVAFLRRFGQTAFLFSLTRMVADGFGRTDILAHSTLNLTPPALFHVVLFYVNRWIGRSPIFSTIAAVLLAFVLAAEMPSRYITTSWIVLSAILFEIGYRRRQIDLRLQGSCLALFAGAFSTGQSSLPLLIATAAAWIYALRPQFDTDNRLTGAERQALPLLGSAGTALFGALFLWRTVQYDYVALAWCGLAAVLFEAGNRGWPARIRILFWPVIALALGGMVATHAPHFEKFPALQVWCSYGGATLIAAAMAARAWFRCPANMNEDEREYTALALSALSVASLLAFLWLVLPNPVVSLSWMLVALLLRGQFSDIGRGVAAAAILRALVSDLGVEAPYLPVTPVIAALYLLAYRDESTPARLVWCWSAIVLTSLLLHTAVSGGLLTVSWGVQGLVLLAAGFLLRFRVLRLQGLLLLLVCILKLFVYDLRHLETVYRILSFIGLGVIMLAVSWTYTRFRDHIRQYL